MSFWQKNSMVTVRDVFLLFVSIRYLSTNAKRYAVADTVFHFVKSPLWRRDSTYAVYRCYHDFIKSVHIAPHFSEIIPLFANIIKNAFYLTCIALKKNIITLLIVAAVGLILYVSVILHVTTAIIIPFWPISFIGFVIIFNSYPQIQKYVIDPYYEERGEINPEYSYLNPEETLFTDKGGEEAPIESKKSKKKNKTIS